MKKEINQIETKGRDDGPLEFYWPDGTSRHRIYKFRGKVKFSEIYYYRKNKACEKKYFIKIK